MNNNMKITFLGTGTPAAMPIGKCSCKYCIEYRKKGLIQYRPCVLIQEQSINLLLDLGPDVREQIIKEDLEKIDAIFVTHSHFDHLWGLPDIGAEWGWVSGLRDTPIYVNNGVYDYCQKFFSWLKINYKIIEYGKSYQFQNLKVTSFEGRHSPGQEASLFLIENPENRKIVYMPDVKRPKEKNTFSYLKNADIAITDGMFALGPVSIEVFGKEQFLIIPTHPNQNQLYQLWDSLNAKKVYLMQVSEHLLKKSIEEINSKLPSNVKVAHDGLQVILQ